MRKVFLVFSLLTVSFIITQAQTTFGVHANGILSNVKKELWQNGGHMQQVEYDNKVSWKAGVFANVPINRTFSLVPQLNLLSKGAKRNEYRTGDSFGTPVTFNIKEELKYTYLELPLYLVYNWSGKRNGFFAGAGPILSYGIDGKEAYTSTRTSGGEPWTYSGSQDVEFNGKGHYSDNNRHYHRLEFGVGIMGGYRLGNGLSINAHYSLGLSNIVPEGDILKNRYLGIGIGYSFRRR